MRETEARKWREAESGEVEKRRSFPPPVPTKIRVWEGERGEGERERERMERGVEEEKPARSAGEKSAAGSRRERGGSIGGGVRVSWGS